MWSGLKRRGQWPQSPGLSRWPQKRVTTPRSDGPPGPSVSISTKNPLPLLPGCGGAQTPHTRAAPHGALGRPSRILSRDGIRPTGKCWPRSCLPSQSDKSWGARPSLDFLLHPMGTDPSDIFSLKKPQIFPFLNLSVLYHNLFKYLLCNIARWNVFIYITDWMRCSSEFSCYVTIQSYKDKGQTLK